MSRSVFLFLFIHTFHCFTFLYSHVLEISGCCCLATECVLCMNDCYSGRNLLSKMDFYSYLKRGFNLLWITCSCWTDLETDRLHNTRFTCFRVISLLADFLLRPRLDRRLREPADGGCVHPAALSCHPREHGAQQPQPLPSSGTGDHRGTAHRAPASVSTHTRTGASRTLIWGGGQTSEFISMG